mmetsp:Transcript_5593/g.12881  ORF Transcript_5593/g.12881 Transcript_5593/m.12881 type:complete len:434 (-) Transcript_5593:227-1528(-)
MQDSNSTQPKRKNDGILIPAKPDLSIRAGVERATSSDCPHCCCQVEMHLLVNGKNVMYSLGSDGCRKNEGGDEFYVRYEEYTLIDIDGDEKVPRKQIITQAVALITDLDDGRYDLDFFTTPMHPSLPPNTTRSDDEEEKVIRTITVHFEYTDSIGSLPPPSKQHWLNGGYTHKKFEISLPIKSHRPFIRIFVPPTPSVDLSQFDQVFAFGDSTFCQFLRQRPNKKGKYYFQKNLRIIGEKVRMGLNSKTIDEFIESMGEDETETKLSEGCTEKRKALILGSCLWDILSADDTLQMSDFKDHCDACRDYICRLRQKYPGVTLVWKSPMAVHIHWVDLQRVVEHDRTTATLFGINRIKYMSSSRSYFLYTVQRQLMKELHVPMLDLYKATYLSADQLYPSDGRHYKPDLNRKMLSWFYLGSSIDPNDRVYFRHVS